MLKGLRFALAFVLASAGAQAAEVTKGSLVIIGGGLRPNNAEVWQKIVELAGGKGARIAVFPTAAGTPEREGRMAADYLKRYGAQAFVVPIAPRLGGSDARKAADDPALARSVREAAGAFFTGGDQARITATLRRPDGSNTAVLDALWAMYRRGGVIAGTSAGAAIMSSTMFYDPPLEVLPMLKNGVVDGKDVAPGLGFVGDDVFIDQHFLIRGRFARMLPAMLARGYTLGLGIDENTAVVVAPSRGQGAAEFQPGQRAHQLSRQRRPVQPRQPRVFAGAGQGATEYRGSRAPRTDLHHRHPGEHLGGQPARETGGQRPAARRRPGFRRSVQPDAGTRLRIHLYPGAGHQGIRDESRGCVFDLPDQDGRAAGEDAPAAVFGGVDMLPVRCCLR
jgi:cyanophycinase